MCSSLRAGSVLLDVSRQSRSQPQEASHGNADEPRLRRGPLRRGRRALVPLADVSETDDAYVVEVDLPGVNRDQIGIQIEIKG